MVGGVCDGEDYDIIQGIIIRKSGRPIFYVMDSVEVLTRYPPSISSLMACFELRCFNHCLLQFHQFSHPHLDFGLYSDFPGDS